MLTRKYYLCLGYAHSTHSSDDWTVIGLADDPDAWDVVRERAMSIHHSVIANGGWGDYAHVAAVKIVELTDEEFNTIAKTEDMRLSAAGSDDEEDEEPPC